MGLDRRDAAHRAPTCTASWQFSVSWTTDHRVHHLVALLGYKDLQVALDLMVCQTCQVDLLLVMDLLGRQGRLDHMDLLDHLQGLEVGVS